MGPAQLALDPHPCLVKVNRVGGVDQMLFHGGLDWLDLIRYLLAGSDDRRFSHWLTVEVSQDLSGAFQGNEVVLIEVHRLRFDLWSVLHRLGDSGWKFRCTHLAALGTALRFRAMLGHLDTHRRQVEHLPRLVATGRHFSQRSLAMDTLPHTMHLDVIWMLDCLQRVSFVPRLSTRLLAARLTLALRSRLLEPVAGWWLATVAAALCLLVFQCLYPSLELVAALLLLPEDGEKGTNQLAISATTPSSPCR